MYDLTIDDFPPDRLAAIVHWRNDPTVNKYLRFVANFAQGAMKGQSPLSGWGLRSQRVEQFGRSEALFPGLHDYLSFLDHVHEFDADERCLRRVKRFES
jgi:hypothetical protein